MSGAVRKAAPEDMAAVVALYDALNDYLAGEPDYTGWRKHVYPNEQTAREGIDAGQMYVYMEGGELAASVILNAGQPPEYEGADWPVSAKPGQSLVIHTLAVHPAFLRRGIATRLLDFAEQKARESGMLSVRLDTSAQNTPAAAAYEKRGYIYAGTVSIYADLSVHKLFRLYEKPV